MSSSISPEPYSGYFHTDLGSEDKELTHVGPRTPCGEYMRRFWQPVAMSSELEDLPLLIRVLGEDLVLFRDRSRRIGLLHRHCSHRLASLEYGTIEARGIRCCLHGWLYDIDGALLEAPAEPANTPLLKTVRQGAYPVHEYKGLIFAYLGPPAEKPIFPIYDTFEIPDDEIVPYACDFPCNWLQVCENSIDQTHSTFLHDRASGTQFHSTWGEIPILDYHVRPIGFFYTYARRVGQNIWVGTADVLMPNFVQAGAVFSMDGSNIKYFGRNAFTRWAVPVDNTNTRVLAWMHYNDRADPPTEERMSAASIEVVEAGVRWDRPYQDTQRWPGDVEGIAGQGRIAIHAAQHLATTDKGVAMFRERLRKTIRALQNGEPPLQPADLTDAPIPTYGSDSVIKVPATPKEDTPGLCLDVSRQITEIYVAADHLKGEPRDTYIQEHVKELEGSLSR